MTDINPEPEGMYNPIPGTEAEHVQDAITRYSRLRSVALKLAELYRADAVACNRFADDWENQAREASGLLLLAFKRKWVLEDANHES